MAFAMNGVMALKLQLLFQFMPGKPPAPIFIMLEPAWEGSSVGAVSLSTGASASVGFALASPSAASEARSACGPAYTMLVNGP